MPPVPGFRDARMAGGLSCRRGAGAFLTRTGFNMRFRMRVSPGAVVLLKRMGLEPQTVVLLAADLAVLASCAVAAFLLRALVDNLDPVLYKGVMPFLLLGPVLNMALGTCQTIALPPSREIKQLFLATTLTYLIILAFLFITKSGDAYSRLVVMGAWFCSIFAVPVMRGYVRRKASGAEWWGRPLIIFSDGPLADDIWQSLATHPERGLRPVEKIPVSRDTPDLSQILATAARRHPRALALLLPHPEGPPQDISFLTEICCYFNGLLIVPLVNAEDTRLWLTPRDLGTVVGLLVRQNLLDPRRLLFKRCVDVLLTVLGSIVILPAGLLIALAIKLDSSGPVIYTQRRIGQGGDIISIYKFRTMVADADAVLQRCLEADPELRKEWNADQKLRRDPRITRMGHFLRKTSLDELPQLWNVLCGSMSLVGPRPIVENEARKYGPVFEEYCRVKPGITGLWQISGRNNTTYAERVRFDHYYVSNWSVWLDLWILARTIPVVLRGYGAY